MAVKNIPKTQIISLKSLVDENKKKIESLKILSNEDKKLLGNVIIKRIRDRVQKERKGVEPSGREFKLALRPYAKSYSKQKGVSQSDVDLTLSGDMLENIYVKRTGKTDVTIAVRNRDYGKLRGAEEGVERNVLDSRGKPTGRKQKVKRPFFRLSKKDMEKVKSDREFQRVFDRALKRLDK